MLISFWGLLPTSKLSFSLRASFNKTVKPPYLEKILCCYLWEPFWINLSFMSDFVFNVCWKSISASLVECVFTIFKFKMRDCLTQKQASYVEPCVFVWCFRLRLFWTRFWWIWDRFLISVLCLFEILGTCLILIVLYGFYGLYPIDWLTGLSLQTSQSDTRNTVQKNKTMQQPYRTCTFPRTLYTQSPKQVLFRLSRQHERFTPYINPTNLKKSHRTGIKQRSFGKSHWHLPVYELPHWSPQGGAPQSSVGIADLLENRSYLHKVGCTSWYSQHSHHRKTKSRLRSHSEILRTWK